MGVEDREPCRLHDPGQLAAAVKPEHGFGQEPVGPLRFGDQPAHSRDHGLYVGAEQRSGCRAVGLARLDVDQEPGLRLANLISQRQAKWLLENIEDFFLLGGDE